MKKFLALSLLALTALFVFSCVSDDDEKETIDDGQIDTTPGRNNDGDTDSGSDTLPEPSENDADKTDTDSTDTTQDPDDGDSGTSDTAAPDNDITDSGNDADTTPEQPDTADSADDTDNPSSDDGDSASDNDNEPISGLPECAKNSDAACEDPSTHLIWSEKTASPSSWTSAKNHCEGKGEGWQLPTIDDLRTLVLGCDETAPNGACGVKEGCLSESPCYSSTYCVSKNCPTRNDGAYSIFGDTCYLWSSSEMDGDSNRAWYLNFKFAAIGSSDKSTSDLAYTRCVKK